MSDPATVSASLNYSAANIKVAFRTAIAPVVLLLLFWYSLAVPELDGPGPAAGIQHLAFLSLITPIVAVLALSIDAFVLKKCQRLSIQSLVLLALPSMFFFSTAPAALTVFYSWDYSFQSATAWMFMKRLTIVGGIFFSVLIVPFAGVWFRAAGSNLQHKSRGLDA